MHYRIKGDEDDDDDFETQLLMYYSAFQFSLYFN